MSETDRPTPQPPIPFYRTTRFKYATALVLTVVGYVLSPFSPSLAPMNDGPPPGMQSAPIGQVSGVKVFGTPEETSAGSANGGGVRVFGQADSVPQATFGSGSFSRQDTNNALPLPREEMVALGRLDRAFRVFFEEIETDRGGSLVSEKKDDLIVRLAALKVRADRALSIYESLGKTVADFDAYAHKVDAPIRTRIKDIDAKLDSLKAAQDREEAILRKYYADHAARLTMMLDHPDAYVGAAGNNPQPKWRTPELQAKWDATSAEINQLRMAAWQVHSDMSDLVVSLIVPGMKTENKADKPQI
jgi:hypothetical protein